MEKFDGICLREDIISFIYGNVVQSALENSNRQGIKKNISRYRGLEFSRNGLKTMKITGLLS